MPTAVACVFDAYGTLLDVSTALAAETTALGRERAAELSALWRRKQLEYSWLRSLMRRHADFWQVTQDGLDHALEALGIADEGLRERLLAAYRRLAPYPEVPGVLATLKRQGVPTAILSNGSPDMLHDAVEAAGIAPLLDHILSVEEVGTFKPAPEAYRPATIRLGLAAKDIVFLSSNGWDVHGAASFGFRTLWVNRAETPAERLPGKPVRAIADLAELPGFLGLAPDDAGTRA